MNAYQNQGIIKMYELQIPKPPQLKHDSSNTNFSDSDYEIVSNKQQQNIIFSLETQTKSKLQVEDQIYGDSKNYYLARIFPTIEERNEKYYKDQETEQCYLILWDILVDMKELVKYDWSQLDYLGLRNCKIDDQKWRMLVQNSNKFSSLKNIHISRNNIITIKQGDLERFPQLTLIFFYWNQDWKNPLSLKSIEYLQKYSHVHPSVNIKYNPILL